jgi:hypothetical protein
MFFETMNCRNLYVPHFRVPKLLNMKRHLPFTLLGIFLSFYFNTYAQADQFMYAVTDINKEGVNWSFLRRVDLNTGQFSEVLLDGADVRLQAYDHNTKQRLAEPMKDNRFGIVANAAFGTGVAAIAFDKKNQRIYYTPMFINQLRYIDLRTMKVYFVPTPEMEGLTMKAADQRNIITRMVLSDDEQGYALTNDGRHLLRFTTGKKIAITDLGSLADDPKNKDVSIHNACSSYGGDMIADDDGNLLLFSNRTNVFRINITTKVATWLGAVKGLPATFTINGAAVDHHNRIVVVSSADHQGIFSVDPATLTATPIQTNNNWKTADLANSNILITRKSVPFVSLLPSIGEDSDKQLEIFPNPVVDSRFTIQFSLGEGKYIVQVQDATGRLISTSRTRVTGAKHVTTISLPAGASKGFYLINVLGEANQLVHRKKILVQ